MLLVGSKFLRTDTIGPSIDTIGPLRVQGRSISPTSEEGPLVFLRRRSIPHILLSIGVLEIDWMIRIRNIGRGCTLKHHFFIFFLNFFFFLFVQIPRKIAQVVFN